MSRRRTAALLRSVRALSARPTPPPRTVVERFRVYIPTRVDGPADRRAGEFDDEAAAYRELDDLRATYPAAALRLERVRVTTEIVETRTVAPGAVPQRPTPPPCIAGGRHWGPSAGLPPGPWGAPFVDSAEARALLPELLAALFDRDTSGPFEMSYAPRADRLWLAMAGLLPAVAVAEVLAEAAADVADWDAEAAALEGEVRCPVMRYTQWLPPLRALADIARTTAHDAMDAPVDGDA